MLFTNSIITFNRGDDDGLLVALNGGAIFHSGDKVFFCLKNAAKDMEDIFQIESTTFVSYHEVENAAALITITHEHTIDLEPDEYYYDIWIEWANGTYVTVVRPTRFTLVPGGSHDDPV